MIEFEQCLTVVAEARVRFVMVGGLAVTIHGSSYITFDQDFSNARNPENLPRLAHPPSPSSAAARSASRGFAARHARPYSSSA
ncbi:MAG TPA: hypothetical protein VGV38_02275 [Pyrinomonadaceae bacterium]|nr:hypothetical protein [Pyrinomonadaceae bacterium]